MLLVVDVGNTNITLGLFDGDKIVGNYRMTTKIPRTSDEYGFEMKGILGDNASKTDGVIISSVVPNIMYSLVNGFKKYFNINPYIVKPGTKTGIKLATPNPKEIGADRIVDAVAGFTLYGGPVIVIDFGTATTYDLITEDGSFVAGITSPGIKISAKALWEDTARLPEIEIKKPESILAKDTITSMQAGLVYGYIGQTEYIIDKIKEESGLTNCKVVATGGLGRVICEETKKIDVYDRDLTLRGLKIIYDKQK
ncbi:MAG: type III pantothenate kinase [Lachnospiraceae bacterium]|nr:type III pantothenate kinase [Lachnospiraceae bacterium]